MNRWCWCCLCRECAVYLNQLYRLRNIDYEAVESKVQSWAAEHQLVKLEPLSSTDLIRMLHYFFVIDGIICLSI